MTLDIVEITSAFALLIVCFIIAYLNKRYNAYQLEKARKCKKENQMIEKQYHLYLLKKQRN